MKAKEKSWRSHLTDGRASQWACTVVSIVHPRRMVAVVMKERAKQVYVTSGVLFSAGVLLAGGFVHLLNDR